MSDLTVDRRVKVRSELRTRTRPVALHGLYQAHVGHLQKVFAGLSRRTGEPADQVVQDLCVQGEQTLESPPVPRLLVSQDQALNLAVVNLRLFRGYLSDS